MTISDYGEPTWDDHRSPAERWRDQWAARAQTTAVAHRGFVFRASGTARSRAEVRSLVRRRVWSVPRHGVLAALHPDGDAQVGAVLAATAAGLVRIRSVISHESAAIVHGLPVLSSPAQPVLTAPTRSGSRNSVLLHLTALDPDERSDWYGATLTSVPRTVIDIARSGGPSAGLLTADAALREGLATTESLAASVTSAVGRPGNIAARWVAEHASPLSESPLESIVRARLLMAGLPSPDLQVWIARARARVDLLYPDQRVVIEADGMLKYTDVTAIRDEKRRQERVEQAGYRVVRITWFEINSEPDETVARVRRALAR